MIIGAALVTLMVLALIGKSQAQAASESVTPSNAPDNNMPDNTQPTGDPIATATNEKDTDLTVAGAITTDMESWPQGDSIWDICRAIAKAEGYDIATAAPFKLNNPGDISDGAQTFGSEQHSGSAVTHFPDAATGWNWLYTKIQNHINGKSKTYPVNLTITQFAKIYAANWSNWKTIVGQQLGIDPDSTSFKDYVTL
jgi:hypothetical protein